MVAWTWLIGDVMGLGGYLMWTAVARELQQAHPARRIVPAKRPTLWQRLRGRRWRESVHSPVFLHNPRITHPEDLRPGDRPLWVYVDAPRNIYHTYQDRERVVFRRGGHAIEMICRNYGVWHPRKKCELYLTPQEQRRADEAVAGLGRFIAVEPHSSTEFTPNRAWVWEYWQAVVDRLRDAAPFVQVGEGGKAALNNALDLSGRLTFRESAAVIGRASVFLSTDGGLMHAANAVGTPAVIVYTAYQPMEVTAYDENVNLQAEDVTPCGLRVPCEHCAESARAVTPEQVVHAAQRLLADNKDTS